MRDEEITSVRYMDVTALRVTPLREDGTPDHQWAMTYHFTEHVEFGAGVLLRQIPDTDVLPVPAGPRAACALVAGAEPRDDGVHAAARELWERRITGAAVEAWSESGPGTWWYIVVPWWLHKWDTGLWPLHGEPGRHAHALGECLPVDGYAWPTPAPNPADAGDLAPGTRIVYGQTPVPPPPAGLPPDSGAAE